MTNLVLNDNGKVITNSLLVAEKFEKQVQHVNRAIKELISSVPNGTDLFPESRYSDSYGRVQFCYTMNRDGFSLLVMGFTGKKALQFKLDFIAAFNAMEAELKKQNAIKVPQTYLEALRDLVSKEEQIVEQNKIIAEQAEEKEIISKQLVNAQESLVKAAPKVEYFNTVLQSKGTYTTTQIAKELQMSAIQLNRILHAFNIQFKQSGQWMLYSKYQGLGLTTTRTFVRTNEIGESIGYPETVWTEKGRRAIHAKLNAFLKNKQSVTQ